MTGETRLIAGTYARLGGPGLVPLTLTADDRLEAGPPLPHVANASFGVRRRDGRFHLVDEAPRGRLRLLDVSDEAWRTTARAATGGAAPCHVALDPAERLLAAANYESGSVALFRLAADGTPPAQPSDYHVLTGSGPHPERQTRPHAHWVGFSEDGRVLYAVDLGSDRIVTFPVDRQTGTLSPPTIAYQAPPGSGPRHLAFDPHCPRAFLVSELASTLTLLRVTDVGEFEPVQILSALPPGAGASLGGAVLFNAASDRLYVTNRGHDSIAVFAIDESRATLLGHVPSGGASPRFLLLLAERSRLLVVNEEGGNVTVFAVEDDGMLRQLHGETKLNGAVFLARAD